MFIIVDGYTVKYSKQFDTYEDAQRHIANRTYGGYDVIVEVRSIFEATLVTPPAYEAKEISYEDLDKKLAHSEIVPIEFSECNDIT